MASSPRILILSVALAMLTSGCSTRVKNMADTIESSLFGHQDVELTTERVNEYPYAAAYVKAADFPQAIAVLDRVTGEQRVYRTGGDEAVTTHYGRVLSSSGIPGMPLFTDNVEADPLRCHVIQQYRGSRELCPRTWQRNVEVGNYGENDVHKWHITSSFNINTKRAYQHPDGTDLTVTEIQETGTAAEFEFTNTFYAVNGRVVYAKQWVSPELGYVIWREMKPYSGDLPQQQDGTK